MKQNRTLTIFFSLGAVLLSIALVVGMSASFRSIWTTPKEELPDLSRLKIQSETTVGQVVSQVEKLASFENPKMAGKLVSKSLEVKLPDDAKKKLSDLGINPERAKTQISKTLALKAERDSKDFKRIILKFVLWFALLTIPLILLVRKKLTNKTRLITLGASVLIFGVLLGSDPSPMGTVKDAIALLGIHKAVFIPRIIALIVFLSLVIIANKFICSWGCQFGTLQEFVYRLVNRRKPDAISAIKVPFAITNTIRIAVFIVFTVVAFVWAFDIIGIIDPFKIFKPEAISLIGAGFIALVLGLSALIYRPWCTMFCPFGLVSWLVERFSIWRVRVDYDKCIACRACSKSCPTESMEGILIKKTMPQDCFSCGVCLEACPTDAVKFAAKTNKSKNEETVLNKLRESK